MGELIIDIAFGVAFIGGIIYLILDKIQRMRGEK